LRIERKTSHLLEGREKSELPNLSLVKVGLNTFGGSVGRLKGQKALKKKKKLLRRG